MSEDARKVHEALAPCPCGKQRGVQFDFVHRMESGGTIEVTQEARWPCECGKSILTTRTARTEVTSESVIE